MVEVASISSIAGGKKISGLKLQTGLSTTAASSFERDYTPTKDTLDMTCDNWTVQNLQIPASSF